jgi:chromosomal replication initiation ATPase DnaA
MTDGVGEGYRKEFQCGSHEGRILGDDRFADTVLALADGAPHRSKNAELLKEVVLREFGCTMKELGTRSQKKSLGQARAVLGWLAVQTGAETLTGVGKWVGRDVVTMSAAVRRLAERSERAAGLREVMDRLLAEVSSRTVSPLPGPLL